MIVSTPHIIASGGWWQRTIGYKIIGNEIWRFLLILLVVLVAMVVGKIIQFGFNSFADRRDKKRGTTALTLFLRCLTKPILVVFFAEALFICKAFMLFGEEAISPAMADYWLYQDVNQRVNLEIMKRFEAENIEFAFPSQTLYVKKD